MFYLLKHKNTFLKWGLEMKNNLLFLYRRCTMFYISTYCFFIVFDRKEEIDSNGKRLLCSNLSPLTLKHNYEEKTFLTKYNKKFFTMLAFFNYALISLRFLKVAAGLLKQFWQLLTTNSVSLTVKVL